MSRTVPNSAAPGPTRPDADHDAVEYGLPEGLGARWALGRDLPCPRCGYNLRMRRVPRCPECGLKFRWQTLLGVRCPRCDASLDDCDADHCPACLLVLDWAALFDAAATRPGGQFEYHHRPLRRLPGLILGVLRPRRLWTALRLEHPPARRRLTLLLRVSWPLAISLFFAFPLLVGLVLEAFASLRGTAFWMAAPLRVWSSQGFYRWIAAHSVLPVLTCGLLPLFRQTLGGYRIRADHLLRIGAYAGVFFGWLVAGKVLGYQALLTLSMWLRSDTPVESGVVLSIDALLLALWMRFYYVALRDYLRLASLDRWAILLSTHVIGILAIGVCWFVWVWI